MGYATVSMCSMAVFRGGHLWDPPLCPVSPTLHNITPALWHNGAFTQRHSLRMHSCTLCLLAGEGLPSLSSSYAISVDFSFGVRPSLHPCLPSSPPSFRVSSNFSLCPLPGSWLVVSRFKVFNFLQSSPCTHKARSEMSDSVYNW